ncbi:MAG: FkbM family methyltransferase [Marinicaulis sp.]|nr:FkbM family methyltransferase [Marinicaulis sp.]
MNSKRKYFGLDQLDRIIAEHIPATTGTFVELGAFDGQKQNNSLYFERLGWRGILIEPNPESAALCRKNRPLAKVFECACIASDDPRTEVELITCGLMTIVNGARGDAAAEEKWISRGEQVQSIQRGTAIVKARTLQSILDEAEIKHVDLFILDVEGFEISVLKGLDFHRNAPAWIVVEDNYVDDVSNHLLALNYKREALLLKRQFTRDVLYKFQG